MTTLVTSLKDQLLISAIEACRRVDPKPNRMGAEKEEVDKAVVGNEGGIFSLSLSFSILLFICLFASDCFLLLLRVRTRECGLFARNPTCMPDLSNWPRTAIVLAFRVACEIH